MASSFDGMADYHSPRDRLRIERLFFLRAHSALALFILFGFGQFALRGLVDYASAPLWFHAHGGLMTCWLALCVVQSGLAAGYGPPDAMALHRRLGWCALAFMVLVPLLGGMATVVTLRGGFVPPFYTPAFFLLLNFLEFGAFLALITLAIVRRKQTAWHARALLGANVVLMDPAMGRLLPMPLLGANGLWLGLVAQAVPLALLARMDRRVTGQIHPATLAIGALIVAVHLGVTVLSGNVWLADITSKIAG
jgi:hypothetical protein